MWKDRGEGLGFGVWMIVQMERAFSIRTEVIHAWRRVHIYVCVCIDSDGSDGEGF
jgi:hypothetical protein